MSDYQQLKISLHAKCVEYVDQRINNIRQAFDAACESGNDETKSTAGDKHETGRAMMQLEQEKISNQLSEALEIKKNISKIDPHTSSMIISLGSLVITDKGNFYIAISAGKLNVGNETFFAISPVSPIASKLLGLSIDQEIEMNGQVYKITQIV